ncbi:hypothetical protein AVEN_127937-1 [Araneus ventricosus]|uniref:Uncharacterized protein n=1 Tax=Araneus ventricosus TaxID=182803 RepID=A0A4Y1ZYZ6_ARAVE|nr:hypothetical protein AVEN_127937-1 [Araneus ventricosus]
MLVLPLPREDESVSETAAFVKCSRAAAAKASKALTSREEIESQRATCGRQQCYKIGVNMGHYDSQSVAESCETYYRRNLYFTVEIPSRGQLGGPPEKDEGENGF